MTAGPLISIIVPVHNQERFIGRCLRSLVAQDFPPADFEIVVVDDGSDDGTGRVLELFRDKVRLLHNVTNIGLPASLNRAIRSSGASFVVRVDSDDYVNAQFLRRLHHCLAEDRHMDAIACDYLLVDDNEEVLGWRNCELDPIACGIMFRTEQLMDIGLYDEDFRLHEERDLRLRFLTRYRLTRLEVPLYRYRRHDGNITNDTEAMAHHLARLREKHGEGNV
jgi:glycosyltransferase involved in cell wall biosynthesis